MCLSLHWKGFLSMLVRAHDLGPRPGHGPEGYSRRLGSRLGRARAQLRPQPFSGLYMERRRLALARRAEKAGPGGRLKQRLAAYGGAGRSRSGAHVTAAAADQGTQQRPLSRLRSSPRHGPPPSHIPSESRLVRVTTPSAPRRCDAAETAAVGSRACGTPTRRPSSTR